MSDLSDDSGHDIRNLVKNNRLERKESMEGSISSDGLNDLNSSPGGHPEMHEEIKEGNGHLDKYNGCEKATKDRVKDYPQVMPSLLEGFERVPYVNIEGPEFDLDYSYWVIPMNETLNECEQGIPLGKSAEEFKARLSARDAGMEFRFLERITLHEDHVKNLRNIESADFKKLNRHQEVLPFKHS